MTNKERVAIWSRLPEEVREEFQLRKHPAGILAAFAVGGTRVVTDFVLEAIFDRDRAELAAWTAGVSFNDLPAGAEERIKAAAIAAEQTDNPGETK